MATRCSCIDWQQRGLGARTGAVDLVRHQQLAEHRAGDEGGIAGAAINFVQHLPADDVRRHQIGCELHALEIEPEDDAHGLDQPAFAQSRDAE